VAQVIERYFGVKHHPGHVWRILRDMGWSAWDRDEDAIEDRPRIKKSRREGWSIVLTDESGFMLQPVVRRT
jgi:transposase